MKALEKDPQTYDLEFKKKFPEAELIYDVIKSRISKQGRVLEIGSGTGRLSLDLAQQGHEVIAIDISEEMIDFAKETARQESTRVEFLQGNFLSSSIIERLGSSGKFDFIISTFALSEFSSLQQKLFLKQIDQFLKDEGIFYLAADTTPVSRFSKLKFSTSNFVRDQISIFKDISSTSPVKNLERKLSHLFEYTLLYKKNTVKLFEVTKLKDTSAITTEYSSLESLLGQFPRLKTGYCIINGIFTRKSIIPGLYRIGTPQRSSPVIVTANYYWTVNSVYNTLCKEKIDCFLLIIDSDGINVWCAAGGGHFTHTQILEAIRLFNLRDHIDHSSLILPQLSATGVDRKVLAKAGWKPNFGPVDIGDINSFLKLYTKEPESSRITFNVPFRTLMGIQHAFFVGCVLFLPLLLILGILAVIQIPLTSFWVVVVLQLLIIGLVTNFAFIWFYPFFDFTSSFFKKGLVMATLNIFGTILLLITQGKTDSLFTVIFWIALTSVVSIFIVLDLAGNTPYTNHLDVESDLTLFMIPAVILCLIAIIIPLIENDIKHLLV